MTTYLASPQLLLSGTFLLSLVLTGVAMLYSRRAGLIDVPGDRHSHTRATPRGGGAGLFLVIALGAGLLLPLLNADWLACILPGFVALGIVGWWDDHKPSSPWGRLAVQLAVSVYLVVCLQRPEWPGDSWIVLLATVFVVWMTNLYNFMDGSNGMAGLQGVFAGSILAWLFYQGGGSTASLFSALVACACLGFLPWNLGRAKVFLGDVGSGPLGFMFAALLLFGVLNGYFPLAVAWLVMLVFVCDSSLTLLLRVMRGEQWYNPHKQHLYQRLIEHGWSHGRVATLYQSINLALITPAIAVAVSVPSLAVGLAVALSLVLGLAWLLAMKKLGVLAFAG